MISYFQDYITVGVVLSVGLVVMTLVLSLSDAKTGAIAIIGMIWTFIFLVMLFYAEKKDFE